VNSVRRSATVVPALLATTVVFSSAVVAGGVGDIWAAPIALLTLAAAVRGELLVIAAD